MMERKLKILKKIRRNYIHINYMSACYLVFPKIAEELDVPNLVGAFSSFLSNGNSTLASILPVDCNNMNEMERAGDERYPLMMVYTEPNPSYNRDQLVPGAPVEIKMKGIMVLIGREFPRELIKIVKGQK